MDADDESQLADEPGAGKLLMRVVLGILAVIAVAVLLTVLTLALGKVTGVARGLVAGAMGAGILFFGIGYFRYLTNPPPPESEPVQVDPRLRLSYLCEMCGLELAVVAVAKERAPRHCGESMVLVRREETG